eukprot:3019806-Rhodomonas_salina.1
MSRGSGLKLEDAEATIASLRHASAQTQGSLASKMDLLQRTSQAQLENEKQKATRAMEQADDAGQEVQALKTALKEALEKVAEVKGQQKATQARLEEVPVKPLLGTRGYLAAN